MQSNMGKIGLVFLVLLGLSACGGGRPGMLNLRGDKQGPDEFSVLPGKPLQTPGDYASLPPPTPGGSNITDPTPNADAVAALGGNPAALSATGLPASDGALLNYSRRHGVEASVRAQLAAADAERREGTGLIPTFGNLGNARYYRLYSRESLDQALELERLRALGIKTPSAPPQ